MLSLVVRKYFIDSMCCGKTLKYSFRSEERLVNVVLLLMATVRDPSPDYDRMPTVEVAVRMTDRL